MITDDIQLGLTLQRQILVRAKSGYPPATIEFPVTDGYHERPLVAMHTPFIQFEAGDFILVDSSFEITNTGPHPFTAVTRLGLAENRDDVPNSPGWITIDGDGGGPTVAPYTHFTLQRSAQFKFNRKMSRRINLSMRCTYGIVEGQTGIWEGTDAKLRVLIFK